MGQLDWPNSAAVQQQQRTVVVLRLQPVDQSPGPAFETDPQQLFALARDIGKVVSVGSGGAFAELAAPRVSSVHRRLLGASEAFPLALPDLQEASVRSPWDGGTHAAERTFDGFGRLRRTLQR